MEIVPLISSLVSISATILLLRLYFKTKSIARLIFAIAMIDMFVGQILEFYSSTYSWNTGLYRLYYFSSPLSAGISGLGVLALVSRGKSFKLYTGYLLVLSVILAVLTWTSNVETAKFTMGPYIGGEAMSRTARMVSPLFTIPGGLLMLGVGAYTYFKTKSISNALIAVGSIVYMVAGGLLRAGYGQAFLILELSGTAILALAFYNSKEVKK